jgi:hypothetical protein
VAPEGVSQVNVTMRVFALAAPAAAGSLAEGVQNGYATASTDCGVPVRQDATGCWALKADGTLN